MKIVIAVHHYPPCYRGGAEWRAHRTAKAMQAKGHDVQVICVERIDSGSSDGVNWDDDRYEGIDVRRLSFDMKSVPDRVRWEYDNVWIGDHVKSYLLEKQPDVFHMIGGYLISGKALRVVHELEVPTVLSLTDYWFMCPRITMLRSDGELSTLPINPETCARCLGEEKRRYRIPGRLAPWLMRSYWRRRKDRIKALQERLMFLLQTLNDVDVIIAASEFLRSTYVGMGVEQDRIHFLRQGRDFPNLMSNQLEKSPSSYLRVGYLGQIARHKGVHILFEAARSLPEDRVRVYAFGDTTPFPAYTDALRKIVDGDPRSNLMGTFERQELSHVLRDLDVVVVPSVWYENSPNVILEAFAHQIPVIASNLGGMAELVEDDVNGLLFKPGDSQDLARNLFRVLDDGDLLTKLRSGISPVKSVLQEMDELESIYHNVIGEENSRMNVEVV